MLRLTACCAVLVWLAGCSGDAGLAEATYFAEWSGARAEVQIPVNEPRSVGTYRAEVVWPDGTRSRVEGARDGMITNVWLADLLGDATPELVVTTSSAGSGTYGAVSVYERREDALVAVGIRTLRDDQRTGYMGHDTFSVSNGRLYRSYPLYREGDTNAAPSGGEVAFWYSLLDSVWVRSATFEGRVNVGTHSLHARVRGDGAPAVVVDTGIGGLSSEWHSFQEALASETTVVLYDRAGYGASEPGPLPRDSGTEMEELRGLLGALGIGRPYVLVGHSLGGLNAQVFASRYPESTAGLVLLDPPPLAWLLGQEYVELIDVAERMTEEWQAIADRGRSASDESQRAEAAFFRMLASEHREMLDASARQVSSIESFGDLSVIVLASGVPNPMFGDVAEDYQRFWVMQSREIARRSDRGEFVFMEESSHRLHEEAADEVLARTRRLVADVRKNRGGLGQ
jgi:pimeloyl-ACP methyl ester carboxylesterase